MGLAGKEQWRQLSEGLLAEGTLKVLEHVSVSFDNKEQKSRW
jgi:hypothetical protein